MVADYSLRCAGSDYWLAVTWSVMWTLVFVIGFPCALTLAMVKRYAWTQFLEADYKGEAAAGGSCIPRMWEVIGMTRKLLLTCIIVFVPPGGISRIAFALYVSVAYQLVLALYAPYISVHANRMEHAASAALSSTYFITMLLTVRQVEGVSQVDDDGGLGVLLLVMLVFVMLAGVCAVVAMRLYAKEEVEAKKRRGGGSDEAEPVAAQNIEMSRRKSSAAAQSNPAYEFDQSVEDSSGVTAALARVAELEAKLASVVRERAELERVGAAHSAEVEELRAAPSTEVKTNIKR
eukprot:g236.t1